MKKVLFTGILLCVSLFGKEITLNGNIVSTHDAAGGGYGIQTSKGVYGLCYNWDNNQIVSQLEKLEQNGQTVELSGNQTDKWLIDCNSIKFANNSNISTNEEILELSIGEKRSKIASIPSVSFIQLTSIVDQITIKDIVVNRGNCKGYDIFPKSLKYGELMDFVLIGKCAVKEIKVISNKGERTYTVNKN